MSRTLLLAAVVFSASSLLLVDAAVKGCLILAIAACMATVLRRESAATRHLVWLVAIVAMLVVPIFSTLLPQWQVLPAWAAISKASLVSQLATPAMPPASEVNSPPPVNSSLLGIDRRGPSQAQPFLETADSPPQLVSIAGIADTTPEPHAKRWMLLNVLPMLWASGFCVLILRLMAARWMLWSNERRGTMIAISGQHDVRSLEHLERDGAIITAFEAAHRQLGVRQRVRLLLHSERTIPLIWGIVRFRLLLPQSARQWSGEQLRSVLLHELAHIKRRDTLVQLLAQIACALHWFNPLVWFAAWRLHVERERACDDLVLAQGVRASAYAEHLLNVATKFTVDRWTSSCGLAMASSSPLESRLQAILSDRLNRKKVSMGIGLMAMLLGACIAIPIAMLRAADDQANPPERRESALASEAQPKHEDARALYEIWQHYARANGDIPGALMGELAAAVKTFIGYNPTWETVPKLNALLPRLDATHDWKPADAIAILDEVAGVQDSPLMGATEKATQSTIRTGQVLPEKFADAAWGDALPNGLRAAWVLEPRAAEHRMGAALKARLLVQNQGQVPVMVHVPTWHQGQVKATDAKGAEVEVSGISWMTIAQLVPVRLGPNEFIEINAPGIGLGPRAGIGPWAGPRVGSNVLAKMGDELTLKHGLVPLDGSDVGVREDDPHVAGPGWWLAHIKTRLNRELPLPADAAERTHLLDRAVRELFATTPTADETATFVADETPGAIDSLIKRLAARGDVVSFSGKLPTAPAKFRVLAADANADTQPRVVLGPGEYPLSGGTEKSGSATLKIVGRPVGDRSTNDTQILFEATEATGKLPPEPHKLEVPDGWGTWAIVCRPGEGFFYLLHTGGVRKIDYSAPCKVTVTPTNDLPAEFRDEVKRQLDIHGIPAEELEMLLKVSAQSNPATAPAGKYSGSDVSKTDEKRLVGNLVKVPDDQYVKSGFPVNELAGDSVIWSDSQNGLSLGYRITFDEWRILGKDVKVELWVRNPGEKEVKFQINMRPDIGLRVKLKDETGVKGAQELEHESHIVPNDVPPFGEHRRLPPGHALKVKEFTISLLWPENDVSGIKGHFLAIAPGAYKFKCELELPGFSATGEDGKQLSPAEGEWTGKLTTGEMYVAVVPPDAPAPRPRIESVDVVVDKDGEVSLGRVKMPQDELKTRAARNAKKRFTIHANKDVSYAKVIEVVEALKAAGVTEFSFSEARVGDGKYRVANRQAIYEFDDKHGFSICRPSDFPQYFTVSWPAEGERPACWLRTYPNVSGQTQGKWAVVWEPGTEVLWWVDDSDVGKMTLTDPARVIVDREGRMNNFSRDFALPDGVKTEFRRLGFAVGRIGQTGPDIGGNTGGQNIVSAESGNWIVEGTVTDADGNPMKDVPVRVTTNQQFKTEKTDEKGRYRVYFSLPIQLLAHWRAVTVAPVLEGFTERDMAKAGEFNVLLRAGEQPQRVRMADDKDFQPGPIPRFAERDLLPSQPGAEPGISGRTDFVMLKAGE